MYSALRSNVISIPIKRVIYYAVSIYDEKSLLKRDRERKRKRDNNALGESDTGRRRGNSINCVNITDISSLGHIWKQIDNPRVFPFLFPSKKIQTCLNKEEWIAARCYLSAFSALIVLPSPPKDNGRISLESARICRLIPDLFQRLPR